MNDPAREEKVSGTSACHVQQPRGDGVYNRFQRRGGHMSHAAKTIGMDPATPSAVAFGPKHTRRGTRPAALHYTPQFAALLGGESATAEIARIKSPAFAASLSNGREGSRHRSVAIGAVLACILVAGSAAALWQFGGNKTARAPGFAGTLVVADSSDVAAPAARAAAFDMEEGASGPPWQTSAGGLAGYPAAPAPASAAPPRRALQAAIDAAPFRSSILGIATAGLPVGSGSASGAGPAAADPSPGPTFDSDAVADLSPASSSSSANGGPSPLSSALQGGELPSASGGRADDPVEDRGHREADRSNYLAAFAKEAFRTTATVATVARSLRPDSTDVPNADSELDSAGDPAASQDSSDGTDQAADGSAAADSNASGAEGGGDPSASGKHQGSRSAGEQHVADASASGRSADGRAAAGSGSAGATGGAAASDASGKSDKGHAKGAKSDGGDTAGKDGASAKGDGGQDGGEGSDGGNAGPAGKGHGDPGGGDQGGGKGHGGKGNGGKGHGGKDHGGKGGG